MKASEAQMRAALDKPSDAVRFHLLYGPDEAGAAALAARLSAAMGKEAERIDLDGPTLKSDPARLADEAAAMSLFGGARFILANPVGDESLDAFTALLEGGAGNPVVAIGPALKSTSKLVKLALDSRAAMVTACYVPEGREADAIATQLMRNHGLRAGAGVATRIVQAANGDRAVMAREIEKLADYLDAAPDSPRDAGEDALDAIGADLGESDAGAMIAALLAGDPATLGGELAQLSEEGVSPIMWLRALGRRLAALADMRADLDRGDDIAGVMKRHRVFWKEEKATAAALRAWTPAMIATAIDRARAAERAVMAPGNAGDVLAEHALLGLARRK